MTIIDIFFKRPVTAIVFNIILVIFGILGYWKLPIRHSPNLDLPIINIHTIYPGADTEIIESTISEPIEKSLIGIEGLKSITTNNTYESSKITVELDINQNIESALNSIRDKVLGTRRILPKEAHDPKIVQDNPFDKPIINLSVTSTELNALDLTHIIEYDIKDQLHNINGVSDLILYGTERKEIQIIPDLEKFTFYKISALEVEKLLYNQANNPPLGLITSPSKIFAVYAQTAISSKEDIENIIIASNNNSILKLKDIATVLESPRNKEFSVRQDGQNIILIGIKKKPMANPLEISAQVKQSLNKIKKTLPSTVTLSVVFDSSDYIKSSISLVYNTIFEAIILVALIILIFLKNARSLLIPLINIPLSLIITFIFMYIFHFSINIFTLLAFVLAIGLVVDDAIVMMENIYKYIEEGLSPAEAAYKGAKEVGFVVIVITVILAAVFIPIGFLPSIVSKLFIEFAWTLTFTIIASGIVTLTITPLLCKKLLIKENSSLIIYSKFQSAYNIIFNSYQKLLYRALLYKSKTLIIGIIFGFIGIILFINLNKELLPKSDAGTIFVSMQPLEGSSYKRTFNNVLELEKILNPIKAIKTYFNFIWPDFSYSLLILKKSQNAFPIARRLRTQLASLHDVQAFAYVPPPINLNFSSKEEDFAFYLQSNTSVENLAALADLIVEKITKYGGFYNIQHDLKFSKPQLNIKISKDKAATFDLDTNDILHNLELLISNKKIGSYNQNGESFDISMSLDDNTLNDPQLLNNFFIKNKKNNMIPLSYFIKLKETVGITQLNSYNRIRSVAITFASHKYSSEEVINIINSLLTNNLALQKAKITYIGQLESFLNNNYHMYLTFGLPLLLIYLILAAQFESFKDPFIILLAVPFSFTGAVLALKLTNNTINVYSQIDIITLIGLVSKNSILIVEFFNHKLNQHIPVKQAIKEASEERFRAIIMTSMSTICGALPMALKTGPGCESLNNIGLVIVGGLFFGTFFTIFVIPAACLYYKSSNSSFSVSA